VLQLKDIKAAQFLDMQSYINKFKYHQIISVFLLPTEKKGLLKKKYSPVKYNSGYDIIKLQDLIYNEMRIGDAVAISGFFFNLSMKVLPIIQDSLMVEAIATKVKLEKGLI
jgi:hypothetical protein